MLSVVLPGIGFLLWFYNGLKKLGDDLRDVGRYGAGNPSPDRPYDDQIGWFLGLTAAGVMLAAAAMVGFIALSVARDRAKRQRTDGV